MTSAAMARMDVRIPPCCPTGRWWGGRELQRGLGSRRADCRQWARGGVEFKRLRMIRARLLGECNQAVLAQEGRQEGLRRRRVGAGSGSRRRRRPAGAASRRVRRDRPALSRGTADGSVGVVASSSRAKSHASDARLRSSALDWIACSFMATRLSAADGPPTRSASVSVTTSTSTSPVARVPVLILHVTARPPMSATGTHRVLRQCRRHGRERPRCPFSTASGAWSAQARRRPSAEMSPVGSAAGLDIGLQVLVACTDRRRYSQPCSRPVTPFSTSS